MQVEQLQTHNASFFCCREASAQALHPAWSLCFGRRGHLEGVWRKTLKAVRMETQLQGGRSSWAV